jgi:4-hydroxybutyrate CoA-transferase
MPSTAAGGKLSRICIELDRGAAVTTPRNDVHYVVTEFGIADLRGKSLRQRAQALISIAHPNFRDVLQSAVVTPAAQGQGAKYAIATAR